MNEEKKNNDRPSSRHRFNEHEHDTNRCAQSKIHVQQLTFMNQRLNYYVQ